MSSECERIRAIAPELALGIADGEDRATALEHLAGCAECRAVLEHLAATADELVLLAPAVEPPHGFEERVTGAMRPAPARGEPRRRLGVLLGAALAAAVLAAGTVWLALAGDRDLADSYRETLAVADGEYFDAAPLELPGGRTAGYVYGYQGRASWVMVVVYDGVEPGGYLVELATGDGERLPLRELDVDDEGRGSVGAVTPVPYDRLAEVRLLDRGGREAADSELGD